MGSMDIDSVELGMEDPNKFADSSDAVTESSDVAPGSSNGMTVELQPGEGLCAVCDVTFEEHGIFEA